MAKTSNTLFGTIGFILSLPSILYYIFTVVYRQAGKFESFSNIIFSFIFPFTYLLSIASFVLCLIQLSNKKTKLAFSGLVISILSILIPIIFLFGAFFSLYTSFISTQITPIIPITNAPQYLIKYPGFSLAPGSYINTYCEEIDDFANQLLSLPTPSQQLRDIRNDEALKAWKDAFIQANGITEKYFNDHIRITSAFIYPSRLHGGASPGQLMIGFHYIFDWAIFPGNEYLFLDDELGNPLTEEQIFQNLLNASSLGVTKITVNGVPDEIVACSTAIDLIKTNYPEASFVRTNNLNENLSLITSISANVTLQQCKLISVNLVSGIITEGEDYYCGPVDG